MYKQYWKGAPSHYYLILLKAMQSSVFLGRFCGVNTVVPACTESIKRASSNIHSSDIKRTRSSSGDGYTGSRIRSTAVATCLALVISAFTAAAAVAAERSARATAGQEVSTAEARPKAAMVGTRASGLVGGGQTLNSPLLQLSAPHDSPDLILHFAAFPLPWLPPPETLLSVYFEPYSPIYHYHPSQPFPLGFTVPPMVVQEFC